MTAGAFITVAALARFTVALPWRDNVRNLSHFQD